MSKERFKRTKSHFNTSDLNRELQDADTAMMEAVVAACALVAYSDGWVSPEETLRMRRLILRFEPARSLGLIEILRLFEEVTFNFTNDHHAAEKDAFERVSQLARRSKESTLLIDTCCGIAEADGGIDANERKTLVKLCDLLQIPPDAHGL